MRILQARATLAVGLALAAPLSAHRTEGLLQASLVEVLPAQVGVEVTLTPGIDIAPKIIALLDANGDGEFSGAESTGWSALFMARQTVTADGQSLPLKLVNLRSSPLAEMTYGHAQIVVHFTADFGPLALGPHTIVCANRYEPIPCSYQCNGLVPKAPGVRITHHRRDERQQELTLAAEFFGLGDPATRRAAAIPQRRFPVPLRWLLGLSVAGTIIAAGIHGWRRFSSTATTEL